MRAAALIDRLGQRLLLVWAGLALGVGFVATPAKFLAPSLSLPVALDVGRQTFAVLGRLELVLLAVWLILGLGSGRRKLWYAAAVVPLAVIALETWWVLPVLDSRVGAILAGVPAPERSPLHAVYIALDAAKVLALLVAGSLNWGPKPPFHALHSG